jgi:PAS domain S-box-containing protein
MLRERRRVSIHRLGDLPDAAAADRDSCVLAAIKSYIALPIVVANSLVGGICLCTRRQERSWSGDTERGLRLIGEICTGSMLRAQASTDLRAAEALRRGVLSSLKDQIVVVDDAGVIIDANEAWLAAGGEGGPRIGVGVNYLDTCRAAADPEAAKALAGIKAVLSGRERFFSAEYHCAAPGGLRHLVMSVTPLRGRAGAVVTHTDVTRLKESEEALRRLSGGLISVQESERRRIARDLHDDVCQRLTALSIGLKALTQRPRAVEESQEVLTQLLAQVAQLNADVETLSTQLHPIWVTQLGLAAALERLCADIGRQYGLPIRLLKRCSFRQLSEEAMVCLYRVGQEALRNVVRHSRASAAQVQLAHTPRLLSMRITDDGIGFDAEVAMRGGGFGLLSMRERVAVLGGHLSIRSRPGKGTQVVVRVPMPPPA